MSLPWFRMYHEFASDPVIQSMAFDDQRHFIILLCLKCNGTLDKPLPGNTREVVIAKALGLDRKNAQDTKSRLMDMMLIDHEWQPKAWDKRQFKSDVDATSTERKRRQRLKEKAPNNKDLQDVTGTSRVTGTNVTRTDTDIDTDTKKEKDQKQGAATQPGAREKRKPPLSIPDWIPETAWQDWHEYRNSRKGWTRRAKELTISKLEKLRAHGHNPTAVIEQSIERGWSGLHEIKPEFRNSTSPPKRNLSAVERVEQAIHRCQSANPAIEDKRNAQN